MVEICCGSYEDAVSASRGGAERIELNSALALGGLTPPAGCVRLVKERTDLKVISMVRPRGGGFCYTALETEQMFEDAKMLLEYGSDGLAFGFLTERGEIDLEKAGRMVRLIHSYGREAVFHRAFDCTREPEEAVSSLIAVGVERILTSGLKETAWEGRELLKKLQHE
ncbi:MAG: copper homeostasis protein CutC, partial [Clostridium sp.]